MVGDIPFKEACNQAQMLIQMGNVDVYQKFTCSGCGQRLTQEHPNIFFEMGTCDKCDAVTDIKDKGCGLMIHARIK